MNSRPACGSPLARPSVILLLVVSLGTRSHAVPAPPTSPAPLAPPALPALPAPPPAVTGHAEASLALGLAGTFFGVPEPPENVTPPLEDSGAGVAWFLDGRWFHATGHGVALRVGGIGYPAFFGGWDYDLYVVEPSYAFRFGPERADGFHFVAELSVGVSLLRADMSWSPGRLCFLGCAPDEGPSVEPSTYDHFGMGVVAQASADLRWGAFLLGVHLAYRIAVPVRASPVEYDSAVEQGFRIGVAWDLQTARSAADADGTASSPTARAAEWTGGHDPQRLMRMPVAGVLLAAGLASSAVSAAPSGTGVATFPLAGSWEPTISMAAAREEHTATLLPSGRVLVVGGWDGREFLASAEVFDPATGAWSTTGSMAQARGRHTATLLPSGLVLVVGGCPGLDWGRTSCASSLRSAELYDPATAEWSSAESMVNPRSWHTATLLSSGRVLVTGYVGGSLWWGTGATELYDPASDRWSNAGAAAMARTYHTATLLPSGAVLVAGGYSYPGDPDATGLLAAAELYDLGTDTWSAAAPMVQQRGWHTATLLPSGHVLVAGGWDGAGMLSSSELRDPGTGAWSLAGRMTDGRGRHTATLLPSGLVLVTGGCDRASGGTCPSFRDSAELWDPATEMWSLAEPMTNRRGRHTATLLPSGRVLVVGGNDGATVLATAELYDSGAPAGCRVCPGDGACTVVATADACDDGNACTTDRCDPATGCMPVPASGEPCDDGDDETVDDRCTGEATCLGTVPPAPAGCGCRAIGGGRAGAGLLLLAVALRIGLRRRQGREDRGGWRGLGRRDPEGHVPWTHPAPLAWAVLRCAPGRPLPPPGTAMRRRPPLSLLRGASMVPALLFAACDGPGAGGRLPDGGASFEIRATFAYDPGCSLWPSWAAWNPPAIEQFPVRLTPAAAGTVRMLAGSVGWIEAAEFLVDPDDPYLLHGGSASIRGAPIEEAPCTTTWPYWFETVDLRLVDLDGNTVADALAGSASGRVHHQVSDVACEWRFAADLEGLPDRRPPVIVTEYVGEPHHPLDGFAFAADEPLPPDIVATLTVDGEPFGTLTSGASTSVPEARIVYAMADADGPPPFGVELGVRFSPDLRDLAGNVAPSAVGPTFRTMADPGFLAEDGFEGAVTAYLCGTAHVVESFGTLPAITGSRSLLVQPDGGSMFTGGRFTARIRLDVGDRQVAFRYRLLHDRSWDTHFWNTTRVVLPEVHIEIPVEFPEAPAGELVPTGASPWDQASAVTDMVVRLPADPGSEAWLDIKLPDRPCARRAPYEDPAILLDDLRAE